MNLGLFEPLAPVDFAAAVDRLILTRWLAAGLVAALTLICVQLFGIPLPVPELLWLGGALAAYNALLAGLVAVLRRSTVTDKDARVQGRRRLILGQVGLDWVAMTAFVHFTGGITSPAIPLFLIHILMVTALVPTSLPYLYLAMATAALLSLAGLENLGVLAHFRVLPLPEGLHRDGRFISAQIAFFAIAAFASVHMTRLVVGRLRERDRQVAALLDAARAAASSLEIEEVLDHLVQSVARALSAKGAAMRLLDETGERMEVIASIGLSERFLNRGFLGTTRSETDRQALVGGPVIVDDALADPRISSHDEVALEGIGSVLVVPVLGRRGPLGVLRLYGDRPRAFGKEDVSFALSIASQSAAAIENALAHEALQRTEKARAQFVRTVTHELRAPLAGSLTLVRVLLEGLAGDLPADQRSLLDRIGIRLTSLSELVNDLLALAASQSAELQDKPVQVDLTSALRRLIEQHGAEGAAKGVDVTLALPESPLLVRATDQGLTRIFGNLIGNAVKYTPQGGKVKVTASALGKSVQVAVTDTGMGIPEADLPRLFQEFFRAGNARASEITGTGLGLAIVKRLVTTYGGIIAVHSELGTGATFTVTLPLREKGTG